MNFDPHNWQLTTERLILRGVQPEDGPVLNEAICESLDELQPWMPWVRHAPTLEESAATAQRAAERFQRAEVLQTHIWTHEEGFVGSVGLRPSNLEVPSFCIGYWCRSSCAGQGYTTEAVRAIVDYALHQLGAHRIELYCDVRNKLSQRVAEKCDFIMEAVLHNEIRDTTGRLCDTCLYARFPGEPQCEVDSP